MPTDGKKPEGFGSSSHYLSLHPAFYSFCSIETRTKILILWYVFGKNILFAVLTNINGCKENFSTKRQETYIVSSVLCWKGAYFSTFRNWFFYIPWSTRIFQSGSTNAVSIAGCSSQCVEVFAEFVTYEYLRRADVTLKSFECSVASSGREVFDLLLTRFVPPLIFFFLPPILLFRAFRVWLNLEGNWVVSQLVVISSVSTSIRDSYAHPDACDRTKLYSALSQCTLN